MNNEQVLASTDRADAVYAVLISHQPRIYPDFGHKIANDIAGTCIEPLVARIAELEAEVTGLIDGHKVQIDMLAQADYAKDCRIAELESQLAYCQEGAELTRRTAVELGRTLDERNRRIAELAAGIIKATTN